MPPITTYGTIAGLYIQGIRAEALTAFTADDKNSALEAASRTIDSYMRGFTLPFTAVGTDVARATHIIAAYDLLSGRGFNPEGIDKNLRDRYDDILVWLGKVADGKVIPTVTDSTPTVNEMLPSPRVISASSRGYSSRGSIFGRQPFQTD